MPVKKKPSPAQLAARAKFVAMVRAKSKAKKSATKKISGTKKKTTKLPSLFDKPTSRQTGTSNKVKDSMRKALAPGKRKSATGKSYTERRANRSDKPGSLTGVNFNSKKYALSAYEKQLVYIRNIESTILKIKTALPNMKTAHWKVELKKELAQTKKLLTEYKQHAKELKKLL
jgi:hypothetical protein